MTDLFLVTTNRLSSFIFKVNGLQSYKLDLKQSRCFGSSDEYIKAKVHSPRKAKKKRFKMLTTSMSQITVTNQTIQSTANAHRGTHLKIPWALLKVRFMELTMDCCFS